MVKAIPLLAAGLFMWTFLATAIGPEDRVIRLEAYYGHSTRLFSTHENTLPAYRFGTGIEYRPKRTFLMFESELSFINTQLISYENYRTSRLVLDGILNVEFGGTLHASGGVGFTCSPLILQNFENNADCTSKALTAGFIFNVEFGLELTKKIGISLSLARSSAENTYFETIPTNPPRYDPYTLVSGRYTTYIMFGIFYNLK